MVVCFLFDLLVGGFCFLQGIEVDCCNVVEIDQLGQVLCEVGILGLVQIIDYDVGDLVVIDYWDVK